MANDEIAQRALQRGYERMKLFMAVIAAAIELREGFKRTVYDEGVREVMLW